MLAAASPVAGAQTPGPRHARGFTLEHVGEATLLTVGGDERAGDTGDSAGPGGARGARYLLVPRGTPIPAVSGDPTVIRTPVRSS